MRRAIWVTLFIAALALTACGAATSGSTTTAASPTVPVGVPSATAPRAATVNVDIHCTNGLYCVNIDGYSCIFSDSFTRYPSQSVTVSDPAGEILAALSLPLDGKVSGSADSGDYRCTAALRFEVPNRALYHVDAFGLNNKTDKAPFALSVP